MPQTEEQRKNMDKSQEASWAEWFFEEVWWALTQLKWRARLRREDIQHWLEFRWRRIKQLPLGILRVLTAMAVISSIIGFFGSEQGWSGLWQGLGVELVGAVVTFVLIDLVLRARQQKESLIAEMGSSVRDVAVPAADKLRREGWLTNGSLEGARLSFANLEGADLGGVKLRGARLEGANLRRASLEQVLKVPELEKGVLWEEASSVERAMKRGNIVVSADLQSTWLQGANLEGADLRGANLRWVYLEGADLRGANLQGTRVTGTELSTATSLAGATLPDGTQLSDDNWRDEFEEWRARHDTEDDWFEEVIRVVNTRIGERQEAEAERVDEGYDWDDGDDRDNWDGDDDD